jgi:hypothetical protein
MKEELELLELYFQQSMSSFVVLQKLTVALCDEKDTFYTEYMEIRIRVVSRFETWIN